MQAISKSIMHETKKFLIKNHESNNDGTSADIIPSKNVIIQTNTFHFHFNGGKDENNFVLLHFFIRVAVWRKGVQKIILLLMLENIKDFYNQARTMPCAFNNILNKNKNNNVKRGERGTKESTSCPIWFFSPSPSSPSFKNKTTAERTQN